MVDSEKIEIAKLLKDRPDLITDTMYLKAFKDVKRILEMPEWNEPRYKKLLTSTIWKSNFDDIQNILAMDEWKDRNLNIC